MGDTPSVPHSTTEAEDRHSNFYDARVNLGHNPPILIGQGDQDSINPPSYGYSTFDQAASPKYLLVMRGGGHLPPLEAGSQWLPGIEAVTESFLDAYVAGDAPVHAMTSIAGRYPYLSVTPG